jgi:hypothetical protein
MKDNFGPNQQVILLLISLFFLLLYVTKPFKNEKQNNLMLALCIFTAAWLLTLIVRYIYRSSGGKQIRQDTIINIPYGLKCYFGETNCENGNFELYSIFHIIGYTLVGLFVPGLYWEILIISVACEFLELGMGYTSKFFLDPAINMASYAIGSALSWNN